MIFYLWIILGSIAMAFSILKVGNTLNVFQKIDRPLNCHIAYWNMNLKQDKKLFYSLAMTRLIYTYSQFSKEELNNCKLYLEVNSHNSDISQKIIDNLFKTLISIATLMVGGILVMVNKIAETNTKFNNLYPEIFNFWLILFYISVYLFFMWLIDYGLDSLKTNKIHFHEKVIKYIIENELFTNPISINSDISQSVSSDPHQTLTQSVLPGNPLPI